MGIVKNLGRGRLSPQLAEFDPLKVDYKRLDVVPYNGSSYMCLSDDTPAGTDPEELSPYTYWMPSAKKGDQGNPPLVRINAENTDYQLTNAFDSTLGKTIVSKANYASTFYIETVYFETGNIVSDGSIYLYTVNAGNFVTKYLGQFDFTGIQPDTRYQIVLDFELAAGDFVALVPTIGIKFRYNSPTTNGGFLIEFTNGGLEKAPGENLFPDVTPAFIATAPSIGWSGYILEQKYLDLNYLAEKTIGVIGDSMVEGFGVASNETWLSVLVDRNYATAINYGDSGTELTNDNVSGLSVLNRYSAMDNGLDYVIVQAGTNDAFASVPIGLDTDSFAGGQETFKGALNDLCDGLITKYPDKKILFINPYNYTSVATLAYADAMINRCNAHNIPVFDNYRIGGIDWSNTAQKAALALPADEVHLNAAGHIYTSFKYEGLLKNM